MQTRLAAVSLCLCALAACGEAVPSPVPADADEEKILNEAAEMIPVREPAETANPETNPDLTR